VCSAKTCPSRLATGCRRTVQSQTQNSVSDPSLARLDLDAQAIRLEQWGGHRDLLVGDSMFVLHRARLADLAVKYRLPTMHGARENVEAGGLMSYGVSISDLHAH
jgi:hypothetical protein